MSKINTCKISDLFFRHQIQHYTQQLAKDTSVHLRDLAILANNSGSTSPGEQRQRKMQRERLQDEFTSALNSFQVTAQTHMIRQASYYTIMIILTNMYKISGSTKTCSFQGKGNG